MKGVETSCKAVGLPDKVRRKDTTQARLPKGHLLGAEVMAVSAGQPIQALSGACCFLGLNFLFWNNYRFTESCKEMYGVVLHILHPVSPRVSTLHNYSTIAKPGNCHWYHPHSFFKFHPFHTHLCVCVCVCVCV